MKLSIFKTMFLALSTVMMLGLSGCGSSGDPIDNGIGKPPVDTTILSLVMNPVTSTQLIGGTQAYQVTAFVSTGDKVDATDQVTYASSSDKIATVDKNGVATAIGEGTATITATYNLNGTVSAATSVLTVLAPATTIDSLVIDPATSTQLIGATQAYEVTALLSTGDKVDATAKVSYTSSDDTITTVNANGVATAIGEGTATITASYTLDGTVSTTTATLTVTPAATTITSLIIDPATSTQIIGATQTYTVKAVLSTGESVDATKEVVYTSSDETIAKVSASGIATAIGEGTADIKASYTLNGVPTSTIAKLTVTAPATTITNLLINPMRSTQLIGATQAYEVTAILSTGDNVTATEKVTYTSSDATIAVVGTDGVAHTRGEGTATITASYNLNGTVSTATATLTVTAPATTIDSLVIDPATSTKLINGTQAYQVTALLSTGDKVGATTKVTYTSSDTAVAVVSVYGVATAIGGGTATITASYTLNGTVSTATATLNVTAATLVSLEIIGESYANVNDSINLTAFATYSDGTDLDVTKEVLWSAFDEDLIGSNIIFVESGVVTANEAGFALIKAQFSDVSDENMIARHSVRFVETTTEFVSLELQESYASDGSGKVVSDTTIEIPRVDDVSYPPSLTPGAYYITAWAIDKDGNKTYVGNVSSWFSSDMESVYINAIQGSYLFGRSYATGVTVQAKYLGLKATCTVNVVSPDVSPSLVSIELVPRVSDSDRGTFDGTTLSIPEGLYNWVTAMGTYSDGSVTDINGKVFYHSDDARIAYVHDTRNSNIHGRSPGDTTITATLDGITGSIPVHIIELESITIKNNSDGNSVINTPLNLSTKRTGGTYPREVYLASYGNYAEGLGEIYINADVLWTSQDRKIASMMAGGITDPIDGSWIEAKDGGDTTATAQLSGISGVIDVHVIEE